MKLCFALIMACAIAGCSGDSAKGLVDISEGEPGAAEGEYLEPESDVVVVVGGGDEPRVFEHEELEDAVLDTGEGEVDVFEVKADHPTCEQEGMQMDVIVVNGEIVDVVCYLPPAEPSGDLNYVEVEAESGDTTIPQNENNRVIIFDEDTDGVPVDGDLHVDSNNVAIYGNGKEETIIDGDVILSGNNPILRGVTITGNLTIDKNDAAVLYCRILGDVQVIQNNVTIAETEILGNLVFDEVSSNNAILVNNRVAGDWDIRGHGHICSGNTAFSDEDDNSAYSEDEEGEALDCPD